MEKWNVQEISQTCPGNVSGKCPEKFREYLREHQQKKQWKSMEEKQKHEYTLLDK